MNEDISKTEHRITVFADNFQFQIQDAIDDVEYPENWNDALLTQLYAPGNGIIGIGTVRDQDIDLTLEVYDGPMNQSDMDDDPDTTGYDHVVQCNIDIPTGKLLVTGSTADYEEALKLKLPAREYGVRIFWSELDSPDELGFEGDDAYLIQLWPETPFEERIIKSWKNLAFQLNPDNN